MKPYIPILAATAALTPVAVQAKDTTELKSSDKAKSAVKASEKAALKLVEADPNVHYGVLENGMKYIILKNAKPEGKVSLRLHVGTGSLNEKEDERGMAHFLEHMVFNGSKHYPDAKQLVPIMQRLGIAFGAHANAYTSFDETVYMLNLPNMEKETMDFGFNIMHDFAGGALLTQSEIDEERGVISAEKTSTDSVRMRLMEKQFAFALPDSLLVHRFPIGTEEFIQGSTRKQFIDFYRQNYRPKNMCFVYVGDIDPKEAEARIKKTFGKLAEPNDPRTAPSIGKVTKGLGLRAAVFADNEVAGTEVAINQTNKYNFKPDTVENRKAELPLQIANQILSKRFSELALEKDSVILSGSASQSVIFKQLEFGDISVNAKDGQWDKALEVLTTEYQRVLQHGFTQNELNEVKANLLTHYKNQVKNKESRKSEDLASSLVSHYHQRKVFSSPETDLEIISQALTQITAADCHQVFKKFWNTEDINLTLTTKKHAADAEARMLEIYKSTSNKKTKAPEEEVTSSFAYNSFGKTGKIVKSNHVKDLDITQLVLSNGVKVNLKKTDFKANSISLEANFGNGVISQPLDKPGLAEMASSVMNMGGLGKHSAVDLRSILAGKSVGINFGIDDDVFILSGNCSKEDLELQLKLLAASISDPGYRDTGENLYKAQLPQLQSQLKHSMAGGQNEMTKCLANNDSRFGVPEISKIRKLTANDVKAWIAPSLKNSAMEISIVGDFDLEQIKPLLLKTVGALPQRPTETQQHNYKTDLGKFSQSEPKLFLFDSKVATGVTIDTWAVTDVKADDASASRRLRVLSKIVDDRMRVKLREELGQAYSPGATVRVNRAFQNYSHILAYCPGKPKDLEKLSKAILNIGEDLATNGASADELERALTPTVSTLEKSLKSNAFWVGGVLSQSQAKPHKLDWVRTMKKDYQSITLEEINALAKKFLKKENAAEFIIKPKHFHKAK